MDRQEIIKLMHKTDCLDGQHYGSLWIEKLMSFANLVAAAEREECAKVCDEMPLKKFPARPSDCATVIRERSRSV